MFLKKHETITYKFYIITSNTPVNENGDIINPSKNYYGECKKCYSKINIIYSKNEFKIHAGLGLFLVFFGIAFVYLFNISKENANLSIALLFAGIVALFVALILILYTTFVLLKRIDKILKQSPCPECGAYEMSAYSDVGVY